MACNRRDLSFRTFGKSKPSYRCPAQIVERHTNNARLSASLPPARAEAVRRPRLSINRCQNNRAAFCGRIQRGLERCPNRNSYSATCLGLLKPDMGSVIGGPRQAQQISLSLSRPQREQQRQVQMGRRQFEKCQLVIRSPNLFSAGAAIESPLLARTGSRQSGRDLLTKTQGWRLS